MPAYDAFKSNPLSMPRDAKLVALILQAADIDDYEPRVIPQLLELAHRHILDVLQDAQLFADHAGRKDLCSDDIRLAIQGRIEHSFTGPPSREVLMELAEKKNSIPLPLIPEKFGLRLPPERNTLIKPNFQIVPKVVSPQKRPAQGSGTAQSSPAFKRAQSTSAAITPGLSPQQPFKTQLPSTSPSAPLALPKPSGSPAAPPTLVATVQPTKSQGAAATKEDDDYDMDDA